MRVLVYPKNLDIGGSQVNALNLAAAFRDRGHDVFVASASGPLSDMLHRKGLHWIPMDVPKRRRPSATVISALRTIALREHIDLIHAYEPHPALEAYYAGLLLNVPVVASLMGSTLPTYFPADLPIISNNPRFQAIARAQGQGSVHLVEARIDVEENHPGFDATGFCREHGIEPGTLTIGIVSRLDFTFKFGGIKGAMSATAALAREYPLQLLVVGGGPALPDLRDYARSVNAEVGRQVVVLTGPLLDPRPAYACSDVALGVGSSVLRSMAFAKPCVLLGNQGFAAAVTPNNMDAFLEFGFNDHFVPADAGDRNRTLPEILRELLENPSMRAKYGALGREVVCNRFSIKTGAATLEQVYLESAGRRRSLPDRLAAGGRTTYGVIADKLLTRIRLRRSVAE